LALQALNRMEEFFKDQNLERRFSFFIRFHIAHIKCLFAYSYSQLTNCELGIPRQASINGTPFIAPFCFVGDEAFPLLRSLMRPYSFATLTEETRIFNYR
jgi:hypothetical protein